MNQNILTAYIQQILPMPIEKARELAKKFEPLQIAKNEFILKEQKISRVTYFLEQGYIRSFVLDNNGEEVTTNIFSAPCFTNDFLAFFKQQPASENFQSLTNCILWKMSFEDLQIAFHSMPEFREFGRLMLVNNYAILNERMIGMIKDTAEVRYCKLLEKHPDIFQNVPLKIIASYLGITDTSLSRIRKEIAKK